jgi:hypothetical protein
MGSWDFISDPDYDGLPLPHAIRCNSKFAGQERHEHRTIAEVRSCSRAARDEANGIQVWQCSWLLLGRYDDGSTYSYPCEAPARYTDGRGSYECEAGHDHIALEVQAEQGIAYASDRDEALSLMRAGVQPLAMTGGAFPL